MRAYDVSLWRFIRSGWLNFSNLLWYDVGDGIRVKFWKHVRCGDCSLKEAFPELYYLSKARDSSVAEIMCWSGGRIHWNFHFRCPLQDWEEESFDWFMDTVYSSKARGVVPDKVCWNPTRSRGFEVRGFSFFLPYYLLFPLEVSVAIEGSSKGGFFFMVNFFR